jgi:hypothetical protein
MEPVEKRLAEWKSIYDQLQSLRKQRHAAFDSKGPVGRLEKLDAELERLQRAHDEALRALYAATSENRNTD